MYVPVIRGLIDRRLLINYRADPEIVQRLLPQPFRPQLVEGQALVGLCLIRLRHIRPRGFPRWTGIRSENAAHRIAVEWVEKNRRQSGVYVFRRDTDSVLNAVAGGRIFPGVHHRSTFAVHEDAERLDVRFASQDGVSVQVSARRTDVWPSGSVFASLEAASSFFEQGRCGYSPGCVPGRLDAVELRCEAWRATPLDVSAARASLFADPSRFPPGTISLDSGLAMDRIEHEWHPGKPIAASC